MDELALQLTREQMTERPSIAVNGKPISELRSVTCHMGSQCYLPPDTSERARPRCRRCSSCGRCSSCKSLYVCVCLQTSIQLVVRCLEMIIRHDAGLQSLQSDSVTHLAGDVNNLPVSPVLANVEHGLSCLISQLSIGCCCT